MKRIFLLSIIFNFLLLGCFAEDFYWVGNGGDWSDYQNHWAKSSNGTEMHDRIPDYTDNVIFDHNSFTQIGEMVIIDLDTILVGSLNLENISFNPEFLSQTSNKLIVYQSLTLADKNSLTFNFFGTIIFNQPIPGQSILFNPFDQDILADILVNIYQGELVVTEDLKISQKKLYIFDGNINLSNNDLFVRHINIDSDSTTNLPALVQNPGIRNVGSLYCYGSLYFDQDMDISDFSADIHFAAQTNELNYLSFANHTLSSNLIFTTQRTYHLLSDINTNKNIKFPMSGKFYSQNHNISCDTLSSLEAMSREIYLGNSQINLSNFIINSIGLTFQSDNATISFHGTDNMSFISDKFDLEFASVEIISPGTFIWNGFVQTNNLSLVAGLKLYLEDYSELSFNNLSASGTCSDYIELRAICDPSIQDDEFCVNVLPVFESSVNTTVEFVKLSFIEAVGNLTAINSFDEGGNVGWNISEPSDDITLYWVGNTGNWNDKENWSLVSGGTAGACTPTKSTHVVFDSQSLAEGDIVYLDNFSYCASMIWDNIPANVVLEGNGHFFIADSIQLHPNLTINYSDNIYFENSTLSDTINIISNGIEINAHVSVSGTAVWNFTDNFNLKNELELISGNIIFSGDENNLAKFTSKGNELRSLNIDSVRVVLEGSDYIWDLSSDNLTVSASGSEIVINDQNQGIKVFSGADFIYSDLIVQNEAVEIKGNNIFNRIKILPGNSVYFDSGTITEIDSLDFVLDCQLPAALLSQNADNPAILKKSGYDTLLIEHFIIRNINADTTGGVYYEASQSYSRGNTDGWVFADTISGKTYFWLGNNSNWHDINNWETSGSIPATCLPGIKDTVVVDPIIFESAISKEIIINKNAYCAQFIAQDIESELRIQLSQNFNIAQSVVLSDSVRIEYSEITNIIDAEAISYGLMLIPDSTNLYFNANNSDIAVNIIVNSGFLSDTVFLVSNLYMDSVKTLNVISGTLNLTNQSVLCGSINTISDAQKTLIMENADIQILYKLEFQDNSFATVFAENSEISMPGYEDNFTRFIGGGHQFYNVNFSKLPENDEHLIFLENSNSYNVFTVHNGINLFIENGTTQTVDSAFNIIGTCQDYISLNSFESGQQFTFVNNNYSDTIVCVNVSDLNFASTVVARLSFDIDNNSGINFDNTLAADASFNMPYPSCAATELEFVNTSVSMWGGTENLEYEWYVQNNFETTNENLEANFNFAGEYLVKLIATDTITWCFDEYSNTLTVYNHTVNLSASNFGADICDGDTVTFSAGSDNANEFLFYINDIYVDLGDPTINSYQTNTLTNNDQVRVEAVYQGCVKTSNTITMTVNPTPVVSLNPPVPADIACEGELVSLTASGADNYRFTVNGVPIGSFTVNPVFSSASLSNLSEIGVVGRSDLGCLSTSPDSYTITILENPDVELISDTDPPEICQGENIEFTASGAFEYEFFINGISQSELSENDSFSSENIQNGDIITVYGVDSQSCFNHSNAISVTVNPSPQPVISSNQPDGEICDGENVVFTGTGAQEYDFILNGVSQTGFTESNIFSTDDLMHNDMITLIGRIGDCVVPADSVITFSVYPVIELQASVTEICLNENVEFTATGDTVYQFYVDGMAVTGLDYSNIYESSSLTNMHIITVQGTPGACSYDSISVTVNPLPEIFISASEPDLEICEGDLIEFTASGAAEYEFFVDEVSQSALSESNIFSTNSLSNGQTISVSGYSDFGCFNQSQNSLQITVYEYPQLSLTSSLETNQICLGDTVTFNASGADMYQFFVAGVPQGEFDGQSEFTTSNLFSNQIVSVNGISNGCIALAPESYSFTVYSVPSVSLSALSPISVCENETISVMADGATQYEFFVNSVSQGAASNDNMFSINTLQDGDYITVVGSQNICSDIAPDTIVVNVNQIPDLSFTSDSGEQICYGDTVEFFVSGAAEFQFYIDGYPYGDMTTEGNIVVPVLEDGQIVSVTGFNNACAADADNVFEMSVYFVDIQISSSSEINSICEGEDITIFAEGADEYEFFRNGMSLGSQGTSGSVTISNIQTGDYINVNAVDLGSQCSYITDNYYINVTEVPNVFVSPDNYFCENDSVVLSTDAVGEIAWYHDFHVLSEISESIITVNSPGIYSASGTIGAENAVFSCGSNTFGQLGTGNNIQSATKVKALVDKQIKSVSSGESFTVALDIDNNVWTWGNNEWGNIGNGTYSPVYTPIILESLSDVIDVQAGYNHVIVLKSNGSLMSWGRNTSGQLGYGNYASSNFPMPIAYFEDDLTDNIISIAAGKNHSMALTENGQVYSWGANGFGQLGTGDYENNPEPVLIEELENIIGISAGADHSFAINSNGDVYVWGCNNNGQLGLNNYNSVNSPTLNINLKNIVKIDGGMQHSLAANTRGEVFSWGGNSNGQNGHGESDILVPKLVEIAGAKNISCGLYNSYVLRNDGTIWAWGLNNDGQLGNGNTQTQNYPVKSAEFFAAKHISAGKNFISVIWSQPGSCFSSEVEIFMDTIPEVVITRDGMTLSTVVGEYYQWYFNGSPINNSNSQSINITAEGIYKVYLEFSNGCSAISEPYSFYLDIEEWYTANQAEIYPNPNNGTFELKLNMPEHILKEINSYSLISVTGAVISGNESLTATDSQLMHFNDLLPGVYYLVLSSSVGDINLKILVSN